MNNHKQIAKKALFAIKAKMNDRLAGRLAPKPPQAPEGAAPPPDPGAPPQAPHAPEGFSPEDMELLHQHYSKLG